ncbi:hypothetical protein THAOC_24295, partial [Thalassiosira oceanica]
MSFETFDAVPVAIDEDVATGGLGSEVAPPQTPSSSSSGGGGLFMSPARRRAQSDDGPDNVKNLPGCSTRDTYPGSSKFDSEWCSKPPRRALSTRGLRSPPDPLLGELRSKICQNVQLERSSRPCQRSPRGRYPAAPLRKVSRQVPRLAVPSPRRGVVGIGRKVASRDPLVELF